MSGLTVRIRLRVPPSGRLGITGKETEIPVEAPSPVRIRALDAESVEEAEWLAISIQGWDSEHEAEAGAQAIMDAVRMAFGRFGMSVDLGGRAPTSFFTNHAIAGMSGASGRPVRNDEHGVIVYRSEEAPLLARVGTVSTTRTLQPERWKRAFIFAVDSGHELTERERVAFDLYSASFWVRKIADARFALLFASVETLIETKPRPKGVVEHVDRLIQVTKEAGLPQAATDSLLGGLSRMRNESIRRTGQQMVTERLGDRSYGDRTAVQLFRDCYEVRNHLLHGRVPLPSRAKMDSHAASLQKMVGELISGPVLQLDV